MKKRFLLYTAIALAIIIVLYSETALNLLKQSYESFSVDVEAIDEPVDDDGIEDKEENLMESEQEENPQIEFKDTYIKREKLTQSHIDNIIRMEKRIAYLTFDDGPTPIITNAILDILKEEGVEATFFVVGENVDEHPYILKRIHEEGHVIGNHTYSHNYARIYRNPSYYMEDLIKGEEAIKAVLGEDYELTLTRFPGGSHGSYKGAFRRRVNEEGYVYIDWNSLNGDSEGVNLSLEYLINRFQNTTRGKDSLVILMHDSYGKTTTVETLPYIIHYLKREGYIFKALPQYIEIEFFKDMTVETMAH